MSSTVLELFPAGLDESAPSIPRLARTADITTTGLYGLS